MNRRLLFAFVLTVPAVAAAQSQLSSNARVGVGNMAIALGRIVDLPGSGSIGSMSSNYRASGSFGGLGRDGQAMSMDFSGYAQSSSRYGQLRTYAKGSVTNSFYDEDNPIYYDDRDGSVNPDGTPDYLVALAYAGFEDTLQFGGSLLGGYQARYVFHVHGINVNTGDSQIAANSTLAVSIAGDPYEYKNSLFDGPVDEVWSTRGHSVDGGFAQRVRVDLYSQFTDQTAFYDDGTTISGYSDFGSTVTLDGVMLLDASGRVVPTSEWSMTSASGMAYAKLDAVPEPASLLPATFAVLALLRRRRR